MSKSNSVIWGGYTGSSKNESEYGMFLIFSSTPKLAMSSVKLIGFFSFVVALVELDLVFSEPSYAEDNVLAFCV
jgi:hypothetical protein